MKQDHYYSLSSSLEDIGQHKQQSWRNSQLKQKQVAFILPVPTEMAILKGVVYMNDTPTSRG